MKRTVMVRCVAYGCSSSHRNTSRCNGITFHRFPNKEKDKKRYNAWLRNIRWKNWTPSPTSVICSAHFTESCFDRTGQTVRLWPSAVPTVFSFPPHLGQKQILRRLPSATRRQDMLSGGAVPSAVIPQGSTPLPMLVQPLPILLDHTYAVLRPANITEDGHETLFIHVKEAIHNSPYAANFCIAPKLNTGDPLSPKEELQDPDFPSMPDARPLSPMIDMFITKEEALETWESDPPSMPDTRPLLPPSQLALVDGVPEMLGHTPPAAMSTAVPGMKEEGVGVSNGDAPLFDSYGTPFVLIEETPPHADHTGVPHTLTQQEEAVIPKRETNEMFAVKEELSEQEPEEMFVTSGLIYTADTKKEEEEEEECKPHLKKTQQS